MYGAIYGDIVGSYYERLEMYKKRTRKEREKILDKNTPLLNKYSTYTDDSIMTIAIAKSLLESDKDYSNIKDLAIKNMVKIGRKNINCGFGGTFIEWVLNKDHKPYYSWGNGSAMRISAVGYLATSLEQAEELAKLVSEVSHNHPEGIKGAQAIASAIYLAKNGATKEEIKDYITSNYYDINFTLDSIRDNYKFDVSCQGSVPQALESFFESNSFEDTIRKSLSIGGDSDTIACISGGIAEAYYGIDNEVKEVVLTYLPKEYGNIVKRLYEKESDN